GAAAKKPARAAAPRKPARPAAPPPPPPRQPVRPGQPLTREGLKARLAGLSDADSMVELLTLLNEAAVGPGPVTGPTLPHPRSVAGPRVGQGGANEGRHG